MSESFEAFYGSTAAIGASISLVSLLLLPVILDRDAFKKFMGGFTTAWFVDVAAQSVCTAALPAIISVLWLARLHSSGVLTSAVQADMNIIQWSLLSGFLSGAFLCFSPYTLHRLMPFFRLFGIFGAVGMLGLGAKALAPTGGAEPLRLFVAFSLYNSFWLVFYSALFALGLKSKRVNTVKSDLRTIRTYASLYEKVDLPLPAVGSRYDGLVAVSKDLPTDKRPEFVRGFFDLFGADYHALKGSASNYAKWTGFALFLGCFLATLVYAVKPSDGPGGALRVLALFCALAGLIAWGYAKRTLRARRWLKAVVTPAS